LVHGLREKKEELLPGYILSIVQAEMEFHRKTLEELVKCESTIRNMGRIAPNKFTGYDQFAPLPDTTGGSGGGGGHAAATHIPPPVASPKANVIRAQGVFPFEGQSPDELSFNPGDELIIIDQSGEWWTAEMRGKRGLIPGNYVKIL
jgi:hypothetical protein